LFGGTNKIGYTTAHITQTVSKGVENKSFYMKSR
jgi:hypothetical protein